MKQSAKYFGTQHGTKIDIVRGLYGIFAYQHLQYELRFFIVILYNNLLNESMKLFCFLLLLCKQSPLSSGTSTITILKLCFIWKQDYQKQITQPDLLVECTNDLLTYRDHLMFPEIHFHLRVFYLLKQVSFTQFNRVKCNVTRVAGFIQSSGYLDTCQCY